MKRTAFICALLGALSGVAHGQESLYINYLNFGGAVTADIFDASPYVNVDAYVGGLNATFVDGSSTYDLSQVFCVDLQDDIGVPTNYPVQANSVYDAAAWLVLNEGYPDGGLTAAQDAGLQLAIWDVSYPGVQFSNVTNEGDVNQADDPTYWEDTYLAADNYGANKADGIEFDHVPGGYGQNMIWAQPNTPPPSGTPGPAAILPFATGLLVRRRSRR